MKILHTSDIHLRDQPDERWQTLEELIELGKKKNIDAFVISGDLFDKDTDAEKLRGSIRKLFSNTGFKILLIPGNHDMRTYEKGKYFGSDVKLLLDLKKPFELDDIIFWVIPFEVADESFILRKLLVLKEHLSTEKTNILLFHGELLNAYFSSVDFGDEEKRYMPIQLSYLDDLNIKYILAGHFHSKFEVWSLKNDAFFVYPGSPVSITKKETGQRCVNMFTVGEPPQEFPINTPHFEEITINLDPLNRKHPLDVIQTTLQNLHPLAKILLTINGYFDSTSIKTTENELYKSIHQLIQTKNIFSLSFQCKDIHTILQNDLFNLFLKKLDAKGLSLEQKNRLKEITIRAFMDIKI